MSKAPDVNDRHVAGTLPVDPMAEVKPINNAAARALADIPRVLSVRQILEAAADRATSTEQVSSCTTGHHVIDEATGGISPGDGWVFGAGSSWGKSSWLVAVADENLKRGKRVLIVSTEDSERIYGNRLLARRSGVSAKRIKSRRTDPWDHERIEEVVRNAESLPVYLDARGKTAEWTAKQVDSLIANEGIDLVAYDYLQEFRVDKRQDDRRLTLMHIASTLRTVVKLRDKASVMFSQLTFDNTVKRQHPDRSMIRDCRDVANGAEVILLGYTPDEAIMDGPDVSVPAGSKAIWIDKVKEGPALFAVGMDWDDDTASFRTVKAPPKPADEYDEYFTDPTQERHQ